MSYDEIALNFFILFETGCLAAFFVKEHSPAIVRLAVLSMYSAGLLGTIFLLFPPSWL